METTVINMDPLLGPLQIGYTVATFMFGLTSIQTYLYFQDFSSDPWPLRSLVGLLWFFQLAHQVCCAHLVYFLTITSYGNFHLFENVIPPKSLSALIFFTGVCPVLVLSFYTHRLWVARRQYLTSVLLAVLLIARLILCIIVTICASRAMSIIELVSRYRFIFIATWAAAAAKDVITTVVLSGDWFSQRHGDLYSNLSPVDRLIIWGVGTGMLSSVVAIAVAACFATMATKNLVWIAFGLPMPVFFCNSLLVSLNARSSLSDENLDLQSTGPAINMVSQFRAALDEPEKTEPGPIAVEVSITSETSREHGKSGRVRKTRLDSEFVK